MNLLKRLCVCDKFTSIKCPTGLKETPFSCLCSSGNYFNSYNQIINNKTNYCFSSCGPFLYPHKDGLCIPCPKNCLSCR